MRRLNKILLLFISVLVLAMGAIWEFLQTDFFGSNLSKNINLITKKEFGVSVSFDRLEFQLFPPGANLNNAKVVVDRSDAKGEMRASKLGVYFNLLDSFRTKLTVKEFMIEDANLFFEKFESEPKKSSEGLNHFKLSKSLEEIRQKMPFVVEKGLLRDVAINYGGERHYIDLFSALAKNDSLVLHGDLRNIQMGNYLDFQLGIDRVHFRAEVFDEEIRVDRLDVYDEVSSLSLKGYVDEPLGDWAAKLEGGLKSEVSQAKKYTDLELLSGLDAGILTSKFSFSGNFKKFYGEATFDLESFNSNFAYGDRLSGQMTFDENSLTIKRASLQANEQLMALKGPHLVYLFKENRFSRAPMTFEAKGLRLQNALKTLSPALDPLKGAVYGEFKLAVREESVRIFSDQSLEVKNLEVRFGKSAPILQTEFLELLSPSFIISNGLFTMDSNVKIRETNFNVLGRVSDDELSFNVVDGIIDLQEFGPWSGFDIKGVGALGVSTFKKEENIYLRVGATDIRDFRFDDYRLDKLTADLLFDFSNNEIIVQKAKGIQGKAQVEASASINYNTSDIRADGKLSAKRFIDVQEILHPLIGDIESIPSDLYGNWDFDFNIGGKTNLKDLKLRGAFNGRSNYVYNEGLDKLNFTLLLENKRLTFKDIVAEKASGKIKGEYGIEIGSNAMDYRLTMQGIPLSEVSYYAHSPFAFDGIISGKLVGSKTAKSQSLLMDLKLGDTSLAGESYPDSGISLALNSDEAVFETNFLGKTARMEGRLQLASKEESFVNLTIDSSDIKVPLGLLKFVDRGGLELEGEADVTAKASFKGLDYENANLFINLQKLKLNKDDLKLDYINKDGPQVLVQAGAIKKWDLALKGRRIYLISAGKGDFKKTYDIDTKFKIDGSILEVFNNVVSQANGTLRARAKFFKTLFTEDYEATVLGDNLSLSSDKLPSTITQGDFKVEYKDKMILLERLIAKLSSGEVKAKGSVGFKGIVPTIDLTAKFEEAGFPILKKSNLVVGGEVALTGNKLPYSLNGEVKIQKLLLMNEVTEFQQGKEATFKKEYDYLPEQLNAVANNFVNMNIDIETVEPIILSNSLADVGVVGNAQIIGGEQDFRLVGKFNLAPRQNKIYFKSNEYTLTKANIFFYERNKVTNPELDISAYSVINDYRVNIKVYGPVSDFNLELSSDPALTQEDVLSLIAFGYTEDLSSNLSEQEKESMTRAGVGSIIFDSFKINETLKNEFGLQVNLGTQIQEENRSYLSRVSSDSTLGRVSSATTIEVKKQLNDAVNLSVTSTVGGSIGQRQSMNLNYNINNKLSVEGVYETRTSDEGEETINDSSLGADVKIRWSFK